MNTTRLQQYHNNEETTRNTDVATIDTTKLRAVGYSGTSDGLIKEIVRDADTTLSDICDKLNEVIRQVNRDKVAILRLHEIGKELCAPLKIKELDKSK